MPDNGAMAALQTPDEIAATLGRIEGQRITRLQVLGVNSLKSVSPTVDDLVGEVVEQAEVAGRIITLHTNRCVVTFDLQRTGRAIWVPSGEPFRPAAGSAPTVRLVTDGGTIDLTEPARTKRIAVQILARSR